MSDQIETSTTRSCSKPSMRSAFCVLRSAFCVLRSAFCDDRPPQAKAPQLKYFAGALEDVIFQLNQVSSWRTSIFLTDELRLTISTTR